MPATWQYTLAGVNPVRRDALGKAHSTDMVHGNRAP
jgi:hypothetical protein